MLLRPSGSECELPATPANWIFGFCDMAIPEHKNHAFDAFVDLHFWFDARCRTRSPLLAIWFPVRENLFG